MLFDSFIERLPQDIRDRLSFAVAHQTQLNPNDRLFHGVFLVLKEQLAERKEFLKLKNMKIEIDSSKLLQKAKAKHKIIKKRDFIEANLEVNATNCFQLACLSCYLIPKMKAQEYYIDVLKKINHPYIDLFVAYFEETPSNYQATRVKIDELIEIIQKRSDFNKEIKAYLNAIKSWTYGQLGDASVLKEIYKYVKARLPNTKNIVEIRALQDAATNAIWWLLHSGLESNVQEMIDFLDPYIEKYKLYMSYTDMLNLKGAAKSYFGYNKESITYFEQLRSEYEKYHDNYRLSIAIGNLSESYFVEGKIIEAKNMMEKAIQLYKDSTGSWPYLYLTEIGNIYYLTGDPRAEESFLHAYEIQKKETSLFKAFILFELIHYYLRTDQLEKAKTYLSEMTELAKDLQAISVNAQVDYLLGFKEMLDQNFSNAITFIQKSLELAQTSKDLDLILSNNIQLGAIHLQRYRLDEQPSTLNTAMNFIDTAIQLAIENQHNQVLTSGLIIRALLRASKGSIDNALCDIQQAINLENEFDYDRWKEDLNAIEKSIIEAKNEGKFELNSENIFKYILPQFKSMLSFKLMERKPIESTVLGLLVIAKSGVPIYTKLTDDLKENKIILSGLLTAIDHMSGSVIDGKNKGRLQEIKYENFSITIQPVSNGIVVIIATEPTAEIRIWASTVAERIKEVPAEVVELNSKLASKFDDILELMKIT
ncbi:MAG: hypothetical protein FK734_07645 [Asgard group archaeon]|nr:hypothetical protein [Asgard group archaeon]